MKIGIHFRAGILLLWLGLTGSLPAQTPGTPAPDFTLPTLDGTEISLSNYRGKVVFLFFFDPRCMLCIGAAQSTEANIHRPYRAYLDFQALALDVSDASEEALHRFAEQSGISYPICRNASAVARKYGVTKNVSLVIDREGMVRFRGQGVRVPRIAALLDSLLKGAPHRPEASTPSAQEVPQSKAAPAGGMIQGWISFRLKHPARVTVKIYDENGVEVRTLVDRQAEAGNHHVMWDGQDDDHRPMPEGEYTYVVTAGKFRQSGTIVLKRR